MEFLRIPDNEIDTAHKEYKKYKKYKVSSKSGYTSQDSAPMMDPATRKYLVEFFKPFNARLYDFLGRDLEWVSYTIYPVLSISPLHKH
jgi:hypothetical protein